MRTIFFGFLLASGLWFGYWFFGANAQERTFVSWFEDRRASGWVADTGSLNVRGFPNRFDTIIGKLELADPRSRWAWSAPEFELLSLSYKPNHFIARWPEKQTVSSPSQRIEITSAEMEASLVFAASTDLALDRFTSTIRDVTFVSSKGWTSQIEQAVLASRRSNKSTYAYDIALDAQNFEPSGPLKSIIDKAGVLPEQFDSLKLSTTAHFDAQWDKFAIENRLPVLIGLDLNDADATWGGLQVQGKGSIKIDADGYPTGKLTIRAKNWKDMLALAEQSGAIDPALAGTLASGLELISMLSGNSNTLDVPLSFANRRTSLGPIPIGEAPRIRLSRELLTQ